MHGACFGAFIHKLSHCYIITCAELALGWSVCLFRCVSIGTSKRRRKEEMTGKNVKRPQHELDHHGLVPLPVKVCYTCNRYVTSGVPLTCLSVLHLQQGGYAVSGAAHCMSPVLHAGTGGRCSAGGYSICTMNGHTQGDPGLNPACGHLLILPNPSPTHFISISFVLIWTEAKSQEKKNMPAQVLTAENPSTFYQDVGLMMSRPFRGQLCLIFS